MISDRMFDADHFKLLKQALGAYTMRHRVIADNIANIQTADFSAQKVEFESMLDRARGQLPLAPVAQQPGHIPLRGSLEAAAPRVDAVGENFDNGINDVDIEREAQEMLTNSLQYNLATRMLSRKYQHIRTAITGQIR